MAADEQGRFIVIGRRSRGRAGGAFPRTDHVCHLGYPERSRRHRRRASIAIVVAVFDRRPAVAESRRSVEHGDDVVDDDGQQEEGCGTFGGADAALEDLGDVALDALFEHQGHVNGRGEAVRLILVDVRELLEDELGAFTCGGWAGSGSVLNMLAHDAGGVLATVAAGVHLFEVRHGFEA